MDASLADSEAARAGPLWWVTAFVLAALCGLVVALSGTGSNEVVYTPAVVVLAVGFAVAARRRRLQPAGPWATFSAGLVALSLGDLTYASPWAVELGASGIEVYDLLYLSGTLLLVAGALRIKSAHVGEGDDEARIDAISIGIVAGVLLWRPLVAPHFGAHGTTAVAQLVSATYPVLDVVVVAMLVWLLLGARRQVVAALLLVAGSVLFLAADLGYAWRLEEGTIDDPSLAWLDVLWVAAYALYLLAALHPSAASLGRPQPADRRTISRSRLTLSGVCLVAPMVALVVLGPDPASLALAAGSEVALVVLVLVRLSDLAEGERRARQALRDNEQYFRSLVQNASEAMVVIGPAGRVEDASPAVLELLGVRPSELVGARLHDAVPGLDDTATGALLARASDSGDEGVTGEVSVATDGAPRWLELRITDLHDDPVVAGLVVNLHDVTARHQVQADLERRAFTDSLTGLANRAVFDDRLAQLLTRRIPPDVAVVYCDLDGFKRVNDRFGHAEGDRLLQACAARLAGTVRSEDTVARLGGDEFAVLLHGADSGSGAADVARRIVASLRRPLRIGDVEVPVTVSVGVAGAPGGSGIGARELMRAADEAMYRAKGAGGDGVVVLPAGRAEPAATAVPPEPATR